MISLLVLTSVWLVVLVMLYIWFRLKIQQISSKEKLLKQCPTELNQFPKWYNVIYYILVSLWSTLSVISFFIVPKGITYIQKILYSTEDTVVFLAPNTESTVIIPSVYLAIVVGALILKILVNPFPRFDQFQAIKTSVSTKGEWKTIFLFVLIFWFFLSPIYILAMDNYIALKKDGLVHNDFLEFSEITYSWQDIDKARLYTDVSWDDKDNNLNIHPFFEIVLSNGKRIDIWDREGFQLPSEELLSKAADMLHNNGVKIELEPVTDPRFTSASVGKKGKIFKNVFTYIEKLQSNK